jgi:hypothetical protein
MMMQLAPPIPLDTPKGKGFAHFMIDYSQEHDLHWVVFIDETGECWTFANRDIRAQKNITLGRTLEKKQPDLRNQIGLSQPRISNA